MCMACYRDKTNNQLVAKPGYSNVWRGGYYGPGKQFNLTLDEGKNVNYSFASYLNLEDVEIDQKELDLGFGDGWDVHSLRYRVSHKLNDPQINDNYRHTVKSTGHDSYLEIFTDRASSSNADYMLGGFWLSATCAYCALHDKGGAGMIIVPFYFIADQTLPKYGPYINPQQLNYNIFTGEAIYKGIALGYLQTNHNNHNAFYRKANEYQRLTGSVKLEADFGNATQYGKLSGKITDFKLDGVAVNGKIDLNTITDLTNTGKVKNHTYGGATGSINGIIFPEKIFYSGTDYVDGKHVPRYKHSNKYRVDYSSVEGNQPSKLMGVAQGTSDLFPRPDDDRYTFHYEYNIIFGANKADPEE